MSGADIVAVLSDIPPGWCVKFRCAGRPDFIRGCYLRVAAAAKRSWGAGYYRMRREPDLIVVTRAPSRGRLCR